MSDGYYNSKKTDDIFDDVCGQVLLFNNCFFILFSKSKCLIFEALHMVFGFMGLKESKIFREFFSMLQIFICNEAFFFFFFGLQ